MSVNDQPPSADTSISHASQPFSSDLEALDQRLKRLSEEVLPLHPYLLKLPTNVPFRRRSLCLSENWAIGHDRPFNTEEDELQYMTFLTHHDTDSLLVAVGDWSDETGCMMADRPTGPSTAETPKETVAKKKISLKDYKSQKGSGPAISPAGHDHPSREELDPAKRADTQAPKPDPTKTNKTQPSQNTPKTQPQSSSERGPKKRPSTSDLEPPNLLATKGPDMHSPKKPRLSPEKDARDEHATAKSHSPRLPALLSPTLPPAPAPKLPRLLSPTLPPDIEKELSRLGDRSPTHTSPSRDTIASKPRRDDPVSSRTPNSTNGGSSSSLPSRRVGAVPKEAHRPKLLVRLRYGKSNRKRVEALLKFSGKSKARRPDSPPAQDTDLDDLFQVENKRETSGSTRGNGLLERGKTKAKPDAAETPGAIGGRSRESKSSGEKASTPASHSSVSHNKAKAVSLTPVRDSKSLVARRHDAGDSDGKTPVNPTNKRAAPVDPVTRGSPSQADGRGRNNAERRAWRDDFTRFSNIGRESKHAAERFTSQDGATAADEKLGAVTAIEAVMSFILAFVADDQSKALGRQLGDSSSWLSILPYWRVVKKRSVSYAPLHNLCHFLGAVSYDAIHSLDLERLSVSPLPGDHTPVPTPGSDGNTVLFDENKKSRKEFLDLKNRLLDCYRESQKLWLEGSRGLSEDVLGREFPTTWAQRSHNHAERGKSPLKAGDYTGDYFLPLGGTTPPIEVVRFGCALLKEWCAQEGVEWTVQLGL